MSSHELLDCPPKISPYSPILLITYPYVIPVSWSRLDPKKANQDKYGITLNFAGEAGDAMFAVYDGHGGQGHNAALLAKNKLPQLLAKHVRQKRAQKHMARLKEEGKPTNRALDSDDWPMLETAELRDCCHKSFLETNQAMHNDQSVSDQSREKLYKSSIPLGPLIICFWATVQ
jgi:serine/threonine protein phosphatase PrpC